MICEIYSSKEETSTTMIIKGTDQSVIHEDEKLVRIIEGETWEECVEKYNKYISNEDKLFS